MALDLKRDYIIISNSEGDRQALYDGAGNLQKEADSLTAADALSILGQPYHEITRDEAWFAQFGGSFPQVFNEKTDVLGGLQAEKQSLLGERDRIANAITEVNKRIGEVQAQAAPKP